LMIGVLLIKKGKRPGFQDGRGTTQLNREGEKEYGSKGKFENTIGKRSFHNQRGKNVLGRAGGYLVNEEGILQSHNTHQDLPQVEKRGGSPGGGGGILEKVDRGVT